METQEHFDMRVKAQEIITSEAKEWVKTAISIVKAGSPGAEAMKAIEELEHLHLCYPETNVAAPAVEALDAAGLLRPAAEAIVFNREYCGICGSCLDYENCLCDGGDLR